MKILTVSIGSVLLIAAVLSLTTMAFNVSQIAYANSIANDQMTTCFPNHTVLEKHKRCVDNDFEPIRVSDEEMIESLYLQGGQDHNFMVSSGSYLTRLIGFKEIDNMSDICSMILSNTTQLTIDPGYTKQCKLFLEVPLVPGLSPGLPGPGGDIGVPGGGNGLSPGLPGPGGDISVPGGGNGLSPGLPGP